MPGLPQTLNKRATGNKHWTDRYSSDRKWKEDLATIIQASRLPLPSKPLERFEITAIRFSSSEPDFDGLVGSFKVIIDGLRELKIIKDDRISNTGPWRCLWFKAQPKAGFIRVCIQETVPDQYEGL